ncbi:hypothetical protein ES703_115176 [subsurface metagenome]
MRKFLVFLCLFLFLSIPNCKKKLPTSPDIPDTKSLRINYFTATPSQIQFKEASTLSWSVSNAQIVTLEGGYWASPIEVAAVDTKKPSPERTTIYVLTAYDETETKSKAVTVRVTALVVMKGVPSWQSAGFPDEGGETFGFYGTVQWGGALKHIGGETAYSVMLKVILYDPDGNYLTEKYATFYDIYLDTTPLGTKVDMQLNMYMNWYCKWVKDENPGLFEQYDSTRNPFRADRDPEKCFVITWSDNS